MDNIFQHFSSHLNILRHPQQLCWVRRCGGANEFKFFLDEFSITFLYVSSSDLVLKMKNYKNYHFAHIQTNQKTRSQKGIFCTCQVHARGTEMTHTKMTKSFQRMGTMYSAIVLIGCSYSVGLFLCFSLEGILSPQDTSSVSILPPARRFLHSPSRFHVRMLLSVWPVLRH